MLVTWKYQKVNKMIMYVTSDQQEIIKKDTRYVPISDSHMPSKINIFLHANLIGKFPIVTSGFRNICTYKGGEVEKWKYF